MAKSKQKYYVVWEGNNPGIYMNWTQCQLQIKGYPGAKYKSFKSLEEAQTAFDSSYEDIVVSNPSPKILLSEKEKSRIIWDSLSVDAACSGSPGIMEYRGVWTTDRVEAFKQGPFNPGTNNVGEFLAIVHGLGFLEKLGKGNTPLYTDSKTAISWVRNKKVKTTLRKTTTNIILFELIERALAWLQNNDYKNTIIKWETKKWGEIPADFGRK